MAEYIDRQAAIEYLENHKRAGKANGFILAANEDSIIKFLKEKCPTADVEEVVHCKDCAYWDGRGTTGRCESPRNGLIYDYTDGLDFCSYGERVVIQA